MSPYPFQQNPRELWEALTAREIEVAQCVANGKRNLEIANDLAISLNTVETHLQHIYSKLNIRSRVQLANLARDLIP